MIKNILGILAVLSLSFWVSTANALFTISNVSYTSGSVTFTIDGDMTGYADNPTSRSQFSLFYGSGGDIYVGPMSLNPNTWSRPVFDNKTLDLDGNTGGLSTGDYTWSKYTTGLFDAAVNNATITVSFGSAPLDESAANPIIQFVWGNPSTNQAFHTVIHTESVFATTFTVGGTISGLTGSVTLQNNSGDDIIKTTNGGFTFPDQEQGTDYAVTVSSQPVGQTCIVSNANGTMPAADVTNVSVICTNNAFIESALLSVDSSKFYFDVVITDTAGETGGELVFRIATEGLGIGGATDKQRIAINFDTTSGDVTRANQVEEFGSPPDDRWTLGTITDLLITPSASDGWQIVGSVLHGTQPYVAGDIVSDVQFRFVAAGDTINIHEPNVVVTGDSVPPTTYSVGGTVSGLTGSVTLQNNGSDDIIKTTNDGFTFTAQAEGTDYAVTVASQPSGQTCSVGNGSGTNITANISNVTVTCVTDVVPTYAVGGTVSGLIGSVTLNEDTSGEDLALSTNGSFTFATEQVDGTPYAVNVLAQPAGQTCSVTNGSGTIATADVTDVSVACTDNVVAPPMVPIPTLSQWALILLSMLLGLMVFANRRRLF